MTRAGIKRALQQLETILLEAEDPALIWGIIRKLGKATPEELKFVFYFLKKD